MPEPDHDAAFLLALGPYACEALVVVTSSGQIRRPPGQPRLLGFGAGDVVDGRNLAEFVHPDDLAGVLVKMQEVGAGPTADEVLIVRGRQADGSWQPIEVRMFDARSDPAIDGVVLRLTRHEARSAAGTSSLGMESLAEALSAGVLAGNAMGEVVYANRAAAELFGRTPEALTQRAWRDAVHPDDLGEVQAAARSALAGRGPQDVVWRLVTTSEVRWVHTRLSALGDPGQPAGWVCVLHDITRQRATESDLAHRATHDPLTGLPNRLLLHDRLEQAIARLHRADDHVAVMFLDIDDFKRINDTYGHRIGDATLVDFASRLQRTVRPGDTAARVGGDEFVIIADDVDQRGAIAIAERVATAARVRVPVGHDALEISASIGVALAGPGQQVEDVLSLADQAMYRAKRGATTVELAGHRVADPRSPVAAGTGAVVTSPQRG